MESFGLLPPDVVILPGILKIYNKIILGLLTKEGKMFANLPKGLMKRCRVSSHHLGSALRTIFIKDLVQDCFLLEAINVIRCFRSDYQILWVCAYQTSVTRLRQLMMLNRI